MMNPQAKRLSTFPIHPLILERWSSRAMTGEPLSQEEIGSLFEAARWAPSSYNEQPWMFLYARRDTPLFTTFFDLLVPFNQSWTHKAALLGIILSQITLEKTGNPSPSHGLDTGAAWENLCLEGTHRNLVVHGMAGFQYEQARKILRIPNSHAVHAMFAVGKRAPKETLSSELQKRETPSLQRKSIAEIAIEGYFPEK